MRFMGQVQPIFQNPFESFNPLKQVDRYLTMTARNFTEARSQAETDDASDRALRKVGIVAGRGKGTLSRTSFPAASFSASPSPAR